MFNFVKGFLTKEVVESVLRAVLKMGVGALGLSIYLHANDIKTVADDLYTAGVALFGVYTILWGAVRAKQASENKIKAANPVLIIRTNQQPVINEPPPFHIELGKPTEEQITAELNKEQLNKGQ